MTHDNPLTRNRIEFRFCADFDSQMCELEVISGTPAEILQILTDHTDDGLLAVLALGAVEELCAFLEDHDEEPDTRAE